MVQSLIMQIDIILEPDLTPAEVAEVAVAAEGYGFRTLWHSNYHQNPDGFLALTPAALATTKIKLGVLAVSPYEMQPLKIGNALLTFNELAGGRAVVGIGGGGSLMSAVGISQDPAKLRMVRGVREAIEISQAIVSGEPNGPYMGEVFKVARPFHHKWKTQPTAQVFACATGPKMLEMAGRVADGTQMSDVTPEKIEHHMESARKGLAEREKPAEDFRIGNFWAWHIKQDIEKWQNFLKAFWTRSGVIDDVPEDIVNRLIAGCSSAGGLDAIDEQIERFRVFEKAGLTDLSIRLFDDQMEGMKLVAEHVLPHFEKA